MWRLARVAMVAVVAFSGSMSSAVTIETMRVGNPGNIDDTRYATPGFGGVNYAYRIGMYEVTAGQYTDFLNAVAATDAYGLYNTSMWSYPFGCGIERSGIPGSYTYGVASDRVNRPVNFVSWGDAARFVNWMHSGQPSGVQDLTTTEDGAYYLDGATSDTDLIAIVRQPDARWMIPSEDEWYKAAYYDPNLGHGEVAYWDYPTQSNTPPTADTPPGADLADGSANYVYMNVGDFVDPVYRTTEVGAYNAKPSDSPYGTFDQGGNVDEWTESIIGLFGTHRVGRGGSFSSTSDLRASDQSLALPSSGSIYGGLRVTRIPETFLPGDMNDDGRLNGLDVNGFVNAVLYDSFNPYADMIGNDGPDGLDVDPFVAAVVGGTTQPIPEPSTLLLALVALGVVGGSRKWKRAA